jgi:23S rRNA (guanosine2251-2'-O)-methyltransferase
VIIFGINPVLEGLRAGRVSAVRVSERQNERLKALLALAAAQRVPIQIVAADVLERQAHGGVHQGVVADVTGRTVYGLEDLVRGVASPFLVVLDGIEDPHNVGAILRTADAAGVDGVVMQSRRAAALDGAAAKASAGAFAHVRVAEVVNIARALEALKELGVWTVGLAADAPLRYDAVDLAGPVAIVLGAEGAGLRRLVREKCDFLASIPMRGHVESLNVSVAAAVMLFEGVRQRLGVPASSGHTGKGGRAGGEP